MKKPSLLKATKCIILTCRGKWYFNNYGSSGIFMDFNSGPKILFPEFLNIGQFHSHQPCKSADYFIDISFQIVVDMRQGESNIFQTSTWKAFFVLFKIYLSWKIRPISVKGWRVMWIHASPTPLFGQYGYVPLNRVWFSWSWVLNRVYNFIIERLEQGVFLVPKP